MDKSVKATAQNAEVYFFDFDNSKNGLSKRQQFFKILCLKGWTELYGGRDMKAGLKCFEDAQQYVALFN